MTESIRPLEAPADYPALARLLTRINPDPSTPESLAEADQRTPEGTVRLRLVAHSAQGELVGYGAARRFPYEREGQFTLGVQVALDHRGRGTGSALLAAAERFAREQGATRFRGLVRDDDPTSLAYAQKRGFVQERHYFWSTLHVNTFDEGPFAGAVAALEAGGIRFASLADEPGEATERALYELDRQASADNPGEELPDFLPFAEWRRQVMGRKESRPDLVLFARHGQRLVGMTDMAWNEESRTIVTGFTGVHREYRGRGLALALKVLAVRAARRYGATAMRTENDSRNGPMLAVNRKLGYLPAPGLLFLVRDL